MPAPKKPSKIPEIMRERRGYFAYRSPAHRAKGKFGAVLGPVHGPFFSRKEIAKKLGELATLAPTKELASDEEWYRAERRLKAEIKHKVGVRPGDYALLQQGAQGTVYARITANVDQMRPCVIVEITNKKFLKRISALYPFVRKEPRMIKPAASRG